MLWLLHEKEFHVELPSGFKRNEEKRNLAVIQYLEICQPGYTSFETWQELGEVAFSERLFR